MTDSDAARKARSCMSVLQRASVHYVAPFLRTSNQILSSCILKDTMSSSLYKLLQLTQHLSCEHPAFLRKGNSYYKCALNSFDSEISGFMELTVEG